MANAIPGVIENRLDPHIPITIKETSESYKASHTVLRDSVPEGDYVSQAVGLGPTTL